LSSIVMIYKNVLDGNHGF